MSQIIVSIYPDATHQTIKGWGVSLAWWANIAGAWEEEKINDIVYRATSVLNLNVFRFNIGGGENPNCPWKNHMGCDGRKMPGYRPQPNDKYGWGIVNLNDDERQIRVMDKLAGSREDIITEVFSVSPPWWMTKSKCAAGDVFGGENLDPEYTEAFADYLASVTAKLRSRNPRWNIQFIEPFNEPTSDFWKAGGPQEGCFISPATQATVLWRLWQRQGTYNIRDIRLSAPDSNTVKQAISNTWYLWNYHRNEFDGISKINTHTYAGNWEEKQELYNNVVKNVNKILWQSETGPLDWTPPDGKNWWIRHYAIAYRLIEDMRNLQCEVWCDWQFLSTDEGWGMLQFKNGDHLNSTYTETKGYYCRKNVTAFMKAGYKVISSSDGNSLAALSPDNHQLVVVLVNQAGTPQEYSIDLAKFATIGEFKTYRTSGGYESPENCQEQTINTIYGKGILNDRQIHYVAPAYSVTTFIVQV